MHESVRHHTGSRDGCGTVTLGHLQLSVAAIAWGASGIIHGGLLATCYLVSRSAVVSEPPKIEFARGDQAVQVSILSTHWPDPEAEAPVDTPPEASAEPAEMSAAIAPQPPPILQEPTNPEQVEEQTVRAVLPIDSPTPTPKPPGISQLPTDETVVEQAVEDTTDEIPPVIVTPPPNSLPVEAVPDLELSSTPAVEVADRPEDTPNKEHPVTEKKVTSNNEEPTSLSQPEVSPHAPSPNTRAGVELGVEVLDLPHPRYPVVSRRLGEEGTVLIRVEVLANGKVGQVSVLSDSGYPRLARAAIEAVRNARFRPATHRGKPASDSVRIPFRFVLD